MQVKLLTARAGRNVDQQPGDVITVDDREGKALIAGGMARVADNIEHAAERRPVESAARRTKR